METLYKQITEAALDVMSRNIDLCNDTDVNAALAFADKAHQRTKKDGTLHWRKHLTYLPYIIHPVRVSNIVHIAGGSVAQRQAALLHDVVEDTLTTIAEIYEAFGTEVGDMVAGLTDISGEPTPGRNRAIRKQEDREHSMAQPGKTQTVKYADLIDNSFDIVYHDPNFAIVYLKEKELLLEGMDKGDPKLREVAYKVLRNSQSYLTKTRKGK